MAISITTNFDINRSAPIDSRMVVTSSTARNAITFKYPGLKVYQTDDGNTYVYGTNSTWSLDGGSVEGLGGIYNGDGILPKNVNVNFGQTDVNVGSESRKLNFFSEDKLYLDQSKILNYFYRRANGESWKNMTFMIDHKLVSLGLQSEEQSGFIGFNYPTMYPAERGVLALGSQNPNNEQLKSPYLLISPRNYIMFRNGSSEESSLTIGYEGGNSYLGVNYNPNSDSLVFDTWGSETIDPRYASGRFGIGTKELKYQSRIARSNQSDPEPAWEDIISISNEDDVQSTTSNFKVKIDSSAYDWDQNSPRNHKLQTINEFVRNTEHKFTKTQNWGEGTIYQIEVNNSQATIVLNGDGNSYECTFDLGFVSGLKEIKLRRDNVTTEFPVGSIITIKFFLSTALDVGSYIILLGEGDSPKPEEANIYSKISDNNFSTNSTLTNPPNNRRLTINHKPGSKIGDVMVFRKIKDGWDIISVDRQNRITTRNWLTSGANTQDPWNFQTPSYLTSFSTPYQFSTSRFVGLIDVIRSAPTAPVLNRPPNSFIYSTSGQNGFSEDVLNGQSLYFRIGIDGNRLVNVQGNFRITFSSIQIGSSLFYKRLHSKPNVWRIGQINQESLKPAWDTTWTFCSGFFSNSTGGIFTMSNMCFSIQKNGNMFISYDLDGPNSIGTGIYVDVWVPSFVYSAIG